MRPIPLTKELVLIGGGHTHALVLRALGMNPVAGLTVTLINPGPTAPYTGMLPGHIAGHYDRKDLDIDLYRLARFAGARLLTDIAFDLDLGQREVHLASGRRVAYDVASIDIGVTSTLPHLPGSATNSIPAKPLGILAGRWRKFLEAGGGSDVAVIGGGVAGVELSLAMAHRLRKQRPGARVTLLERGEAMAALPKASSEKLRTRMNDAKIILREEVNVVRVSDEAVHLEGGEAIPSTFTVSAAGARPHAWLANTGLKLKDGYISVDANLRTSDSSVYAAGDCVHLSHAPRPKAGVFAVRAAPVLTANLTAAVAGGAQRRFNPQRDYLKLVSLGEKDALGEKAGIALSGPWVWRVKDRIDRAFMKKLNDLEPMRPAPVPKRKARGVTEELSGKPMLCGGCGAKVGSAALSGALGELGDDAAVYTVNGATRGLTTDLLNAFTGDPYLIAKIAAYHAMGDIWAMGGTPETALAQITLPRMADKLQTCWVKDITDAARSVFEAENVTLAGGHTTQGAALQIGFTIEGAVPDSGPSPTGARDGDALVLTRPLGSGVLLAADMGLQASGDDLAHLFKTMTTSQADAAGLLAAANALTDVTGFGLAGHLSHILKASALGAEIWIEQVPVFRGVVEAMNNGVRSTLFQTNKDAVDVRSTAKLPHDILFDPQTAGGLLAAVPARTSKDLVSRLADLGHQAAEIGKLTPAAPTIQVI